MNVVNEVPPTGTSRTANVPQTVDFQAFPDGAPDWHKQLIMALRPPADQLHAVWGKRVARARAWHFADWHDKDFFDAKLGRGGAGNN